MCNFLIIMSQQSVSEIFCARSVYAFVGSQRVDNYLVIFCCFAIVLFCISVGECSLSDCELLLFWSLLSINVETQIIL